MNVGTTLRPLHGKVTQRFISRKLDVSVSTVSRALNDNPLVNAETKKKILEFAHQFDYSPNEVALSLKNRKTKRVGIAFERDFPQVQLMAVVNIVLENEHWPVMASVEQVSELIRNGLDGVIVLGQTNKVCLRALPYIELKASDEDSLRQSAGAFFEVLKTTE